ncbi:MAG TPA: flagellar basal body rod protein FlgB [Acetobacteraceae bacterium]|jgi:flagellar basal-body rod protein FlgB|nr:flagellar basal body rod protein FlgB [Acetobacteraceae bacterium]
MDPDRIALFDLADQRLAWASKRETVLAQNLANADTPGWRARDVKPFDASLAEASLIPAMTDSRHMAGTSVTDLSLQTSTGEHAPDGNAVSVDAELVKVAQTDLAHAVTSDLYKAYLGMFRTAIGR